MDGYALRQGVSKVGAKKRSIYIKKNKCYAISNGDE